MVVIVGDSFVTIIVVVPLMYFVELILVVFSDSIEVVVTCLSGVAVTVVVTTSVVKLSLVVTDVVSFTVVSSSDVVDGDATADAAAAAPPRKAPPMADESFHISMDGTSEAVTALLGRNKDNYVLNFEGESALS